MHPSALRAGRALVTVSIACSVIACGESSRSRQSTASREVELATTDLRLDATSGERFGTGARMEARSVAPSNPHSSSRLAWTLPEGWTEVAPTQMRTANFLVRGDARAECYLTFLAGDAGGLAANIHRWCTQLSRPPLSRAAIEALPREPMLGGEAVMVDLEGTWTGMSGAQRDADYRLLGFLLVGPDGSAFLKCVGPKSVLDGEVEAFRALARSFGRGSAIAPAHGGGAATAATAAPAAPAAPNGMDPAAFAPTSQGGLTWEAPRGWRRAPDRATRAVSFFVGPGDDVECYVTVLAGDAGGALANLNRWRKQLGRDEVTSADLAALERVPMLGGEGLVVEIEGGAATESASTLLFGALFSGPARSVFVKLTGPVGVVDAQREAFRVFCRSLASAE